MVYGLFILSIIISYFLEKNGFKNLKNNDNKKNVIN